MPGANILSFFGGLHIEQGFLLCHAHLVGGISLDKLLGEDSLLVDGIETACADLNHISSI